MLVEFKNSCILSRAWLPAHVFRILHACSPTGHGCNHVSAGHTQHKQQVRVGCASLKQHSRPCNKTCMWHCHILGSTPNDIQHSDDSCRLDTTMQDGQMHIESHFRHVACWSQVPAHCPHGVHARSAGHPAPSIAGEGRAHLLRRCSP